MPELAKGPPSRRRTWMIWTLVWMVLAIVAWYVVVQGADWRTLIDPGQPASVMLFIVLMSLLPIVGFPISAFYIFLGAVFPVWLGMIAGLISLAINMSLSYALARYVWRAPLREKFSRRWPNWFNLDTTSTIRITVLVRAVPGVPFAMQNYLLGVLATPFPSYLGLSLGIQGCIMLGVILTTRGVLDQNGQMALWGGLVVGITLVSLRMIHRHRASLRS